MRKIWIAVALVSLAVAGAGCKSKLEKCYDACKGVQPDALESCHSLCKMAVGEKPDPKKDEKLCDKGDAKACEELAEMYALGRGGVTKDDTKATVLFEKACSLGSAVSCEFRGKMLRDGRGTPPDKLGAIVWLTKGCNGGAAGACTSLGLDAMQKGDKKSAVELLDKACSGKDKLGCMGLAGLYLHGNGVKKDVPKAKELLKKSCDYGAKQACEKLLTL
jgi:uncharacterized protein